VNIILFCLESSVIYGVRDRKNFAAELGKGESDPSGVSQFIGSGDSVEGMDDR